MKRIWIPLIVAGTLLQLTACKEKVQKTTLTKEVSFTKEGELRLLKATTDSVVAHLDIEIADDDYQTETGLMYRKSMPTNQAMLFIFKEEGMLAFYMKNTEFPLDIIYVNSNLEIVGIQKNAKPFNESSLPSDAPALYVLEINAGLSDQWGLNVGDRIDWLRTDN